MTKYFLKHLAKNILQVVATFGILYSFTVVADKLPYCKPGDVLYDDKRWTIERWNKLGGHGFLVYYEPSWSCNND